MQVNHGTNNFRIDGRVNYLGEANYFVFEHKEAPKDTPINIEVSDAVLLNSAKRKPLRNLVLEVVWGQSKLP